MNRKKEKLRVILVDDMRDEHLIFLKVLNSLEFLDLELVSCYSAVDLEQLLATPGQTTPHIVFLDMHMPGKSGMECLRDIRSNQKYKETVVAMYSVSADEDTIGNCLGAGANIFITKPRDLSVLKNTLDKVLKSCLQYHSMALNFETFVRTF